MHNYLTDRKHRTEVNNSFIDFIDLLNFRPSFIHYLHLRSFFIEEENVTSYADRTTSYSNGKNVATVLENIETKGKEGFSWFSINYQKVSTLTNFKR